LPAPIGIPDELVSHFIRGFFDGDGSVSNPNINKKNYPIVTIATESDGLREWIVSKINIPCYNSHGRIEWSHNNALDFLGILYKNARIYMDRKYELYTQWCAFVPGLRGKLSSIQLPHLKIIKTRKDAILPDKTRISDSGYDLTIIEKIKQVGDVELFTTGIKIKPEFGWYTIVVPRSSIIKSGYMLANSIGIIDRTYIGEVIIALRKTNVLMPDIKLPCRIAQLIPQPIIHMVIEEVDELPNSDRGECGFGSTGV
jgi:deoxyuridine 5'-triphosphate nucleotidohydrolase